MFVSNSMTEKVVSIDNDADIFEAKEKMDQNRIRHLPVIGKDNYVVGIITDRDIRSVLPSIVLHDSDKLEEREKLSKFKITFL